MQFVKPTIILILTVYAWLIVMYVVFNFMYTTLGKRGVIVTTLRQTTYDFCKPFLNIVGNILPRKYVEFGPLIIFVVLRVLVYTISKINF